MPNMKEKNIYLFIWVLTFEQNRAQPLTHAKMKMGTYISIFIQSANFIWYIPSS